MVRASQKRRSKKWVDLSTLFIFIAIILVVNFGAQFAFGRFDLTSEKRYTLSDVTIEKRDFCGNRRAKSSRQIIVNNAFVTMCPRNLNKRTADVTSTAYHEKLHDSSLDNSGRDLRAAELNL